MQYLLFPAFLAMSLITVALAVALWRTRALVRRAQAYSERERATREAALRIEAIAYERERIYNDLHDDLGARLLSLIHAAPTPQQADQARAILQDLRDVVTRSRGTPGTLGDVLADIRNEAAQRLAAINIDLAWQEIDALPNPPLDTERALHLHRIVREAISNTIRHAQARRLRVRLRFSGGRLDLELTDDGEGVDATTARAGTGMRSMRDHAAELAGDIRWTTGSGGGTKVLLSMPLQADGIGQ